MHNITNHGQCILYMAISMQIIYTYEHNIYGPAHSTNNCDKKGPRGGRQRVGGMLVMMATLQATTLQTVFAPYGHIAASTALKTNFPKVWTSRRQTQRHSGSATATGLGIGCTGHAQKKVRAPQRARGHVKLFEVWRDMSASRWCRWRRATW